VQACGDTINSNPSIRLPETPSRPLPVRLSCHRILFKIQIVKHPAASPPSPCPRTGTVRAGCLSRWLRLAGSYGFAPVDGGASLYNVRI
jgi:hypothetical protein